MSLFRNLNFSALVPTTISPTNPVTPTTPTTPTTTTIIPEVFVPITPVIIPQQSNEIFSLKQPTKQPIIESPKTDFLSDLIGGLFSTVQETAVSAFRETNIGKSLESEYKAQVIKEQSENIWLYVIASALILFFVFPWIKLLFKR